jgi:hypothetical protein
MTEEGYANQEIVYSSIWIPLGVQSSSGRRTRSSYTSSTQHNARFLG